MNFSFITVRLGKDSIPDIERICMSEVGVLNDSFAINVKCTQFSLMHLDVLKYC